MVDFGGFFLDGTPKLEDATGGRSFRLSVRMPFEEMDADRFGLIVKDFFVFLFGCRGVSSCGGDGGGEAYNTDSCTW